MARSDGKPGLRAGVAPSSVDPTEEALATLQGAPAITQTRTAYQTAITVHKARNLADVEAKIMEEASRAGEAFIYAWRVGTKDPKKDEGDGKTTIEGVSIDGAMILARNWGNCVVPVRIEQESQTHFVLAAEFIDLETGFTVPRLYRQRKRTGNEGRMDADRAEDMTFQIGQSKAQRNVIVKAIPQWIQDKAVEVAKDRAAEKYVDTAAWFPKVVSYIEQALRIPMANVVHRMRGKKPEQWSKFDILTLKLAFAAIKEGDSTVDTEFPAPADAEAKPAAAASETVTTPSGQQVEVPSGSPATAERSPPGGGETKAAEVPAPKEKTAEEREAEEAERAIAAREARDAAAKGAPPVPTVSDLFAPPPVKK
jgi:hypothetical protein